MEFYEHRLNVVCWKTKQFTLEDALLSSEATEDARSVNAHCMCYTVIYKANESTRYYLKDFLLVFSEGTTPKYL